MPSVEEGQLRKQIAGGELQGLFVVAGEEKYLVRRLAQQLSLIHISEPTRP